MNIIIHANEKDNLVTCVRPLVKGEKISIDGKSYIVNDNIPVFHKMATENVKKGDVVYKYGEVIGIATVDIKAGDYVHVHNIESTRGRGDKK
ncbi:UxaA family hydrolase [Clostridioides difficile]|uniref:N-terminus region of carbohydrate hydrolase, SAF domain n=2 Tax=Clostridioides difficile TaxID=1496 RepID=A0AAX3H0E6_CLODI|nr:UxaA family hydrolase [Clostridioides difficile]AVD37308.1 altronate hydrolase [Clostridioides difficile]AVD39239.1 altronate hydrolase [Clostridioides difficile]AVD42761.1 altronate hydrolase [Clostridioides difficile]AXU69346.1 altronate hydrolase [Clostridioides difficile]AXU91479.1 altronate hydrolase [Clostridioides difficile]